MPTLYRKYRPQSFSDITDQEHIVRTIANEIAIDKMAHAYLFSGPRGVGKTTIARLLAKSVNCDKRKPGDFEPCNECSSCEEISAGRNIDVMEVDAASHTGVDNVRENIIENAQFRPTKSKYKVFIIDEAHMLSVSAFNALLKTLEEPPAHAIFVLATTELRKLPATVISRCQRFNFKKIAYEEMKKRLRKIAKEEKIDVDKKVIDRIINKSDGALRDAESLLGQLFSLNLKKISPEDAEIILPVSDIGTVIDFISCIADGNAREALIIAQKLGEEGVGMEQFMFDIIEILRDMIIAQTGYESQDAIDYSDDDRKRVKKLAKEIPGPKLIALIEAAMEKRREIRSAPIPTLPLELFALENASARGCESADGQTPPSPSDHNSPPSQGGAGGYPLSSKDPSLTSSSKGVMEVSAQPIVKPRAITSAIKETISHLTHHRVKTGFDELKDKWQEIIKKITVKNPSLAFIIKMGDLSSLDERGNLRLSVPYSIHKEKIEDNKSKKIIEDCLNELFGEKFRVSAEVTVALPSPTPTSDKELSNLAAEFGGEIVE